MNLNALFDCLGDAAVPWSSPLVRAMKKPFYRLEPAFPGVIFPRIGAV